MGGRASAAETCQPLFCRCDSKFIGQQLHQLQHVEHKRTKYPPQLCVDVLGVGRAQQECYDRRVISMIGTFCCGLLGAQKASTGLATSFLSFYVNVPELGSSKARESSSNTV